MADALVAIVVSGVVGFVLGVAVGRRDWPRSSPRSPYLAVRVPDPTGLAFKRAAALKK